MRRITLATLAAVSLTAIGAALAGAELTLLAQRDRAERRASLLAVSTAARMERLGDGMHQAHNVCLQQFCQFTLHRGEAAGLNLHQSLRLQYT